MPSAQHRRSRKHQPDDRHDGDARGRSRPRAAEFARAFAAQATAVGANEPGNRLYRLFRLRTAPFTYLIVEIYDDEAALAVPFVVRPPEIEVFDVVPQPA